MADLKPTTDFEKAKQVVCSIRKMQQKGERPFDKEDLYPDAIVEGMTPGSRQHAQFLFYSCMIDEASDATIVYDSMRKFASDFDLGDLPKIKREDLKKVMKKPFERLGDPEKALVNPLDTLYHNSRKLESEFEGDPRLMLRQGTGPTIKMIMFGKTGPRKPREKFKRYGEGKSALLMKNFVRFGMWDFKPYEIPIKIDRHAIRIGLGTGVAVIPEGLTRGRAGSLVKMLRQVYHEVCMQGKYSAVDLNDGMWAVGRYNCRFNNDIFCQTSCRIGCDHRPEIEGSAKKSSGMASWYLPGTDKRRDQDNLFRYAAQNGEKK